MIESYSNFTICISEEDNIDKNNIKRLEETTSNNIYRISFNSNCERWGTEYGGFYIPKDFIIEKSFLVYSFGIGEDLLFSEEVIARGGICYAFDPTPKEIKYVENHKLSENPMFHFLSFGLSDKNGRFLFANKNRLCFCICYQT